MLATLVEPLVDLVLPRECAGCERPGEVWCATCRDTLEPCSTRLGSLPVVAAGAYDGDVRRALLAYKERRRRDLARPLGRALGATIGPLLEQAGLGPAQALIVCVPSAPAAAARRGGDHVVRLASHAARVGGVRVARGLLRIRPDVLDSAGLTAAGRARNLSGAMQVARCAPAGARSAIVLDDIVSSGATVLEATRALRAAGWPVAGAVALAATPAAGSGAAVQWQHGVAQWHRHFSRAPLAPPR
ncbi:ComF family protein [Jatrophihabitans endophyticus]|uniref:ComF family protein n=1 Tax=Jatrophihabitans endophyticus TaxID=1206085 RepID=UPI0019FA2605|nr:hypothetical protein [Jatrophihabitans endophyticus]MBE7188811.1 ComF family protein [Jatrophihabitans endophyticus]